MHDETDDTIERIAATLRRLPEVDASHKARVLAAVAAERARSRDAGDRGPRSRRLAFAGGGAVAAIVAVALWSGVRNADDAAETSARAAQPAAAPAGDAGGARFAARTGDAVAPRAVELVFRAPTARRVSVVGDFNGWDARANEMTQDPASGLWSDTITLRPGRHVYAFVVDDSVWARDPRTPAAPDADFGRPGSVLLVGQP